MKAADVLYARVQLILEYLAPCRTVSGAPIKAGLSRPHPDLPQWWTEKAVLCDPTASLLPSENGDVVIQIWSWDKEQEQESPPIDFTIPASWLAARTWWEIPAMIEAHARRREREKQKEVLRALKGAL